jgi:hypothetical protein
MEDVMGKPGQCIEFSLRGLGEIVSAIQELNNRIDDLESDTAKENTTIESRLAAVENSLNSIEIHLVDTSNFVPYVQQPGSPSPAPSAPILERIADAFGFGLRCPKCQEGWPSVRTGWFNLKPGDPCPKCSAQKNGE